MEDIESKIQENLNDFRNIPNLKKELIKDRLLLVSKKKDHPLIREIDNTLSNEGILCNEPYQIHMPEKELENLILQKNWRPLLDDTSLGCGLNVLSFLDIVPKKSARAKITCLNLDTGFPMSEIKDLIVRNKKIPYAMYVNKIAFNFENLTKFIFNTLQNENLTIIRAYTSNASKSGHTMILYKSGIKLYLLHPQQEVYAELGYLQNRFAIRPFLFMPASKNNYQYIQEYLNKCVSFEFLTVNKKIQVVAPERKRPTFQPLILTEENPFHMFLLIAHGATLYADKHKEFLEFPFHSLGFFVEKDLVLFGKNIEVNIDSIIDDVSDAMKGTLSNIYITRTDPLGNKILGSRANTSDVIVNTTGKIEVYPMNWSVTIHDTPDMKSVIGLYHLVYNRGTGKFDQVEKIFTYDYFIDPTTGKPIQLYYGHIIRKCNEYYKSKKAAYFKNIPREMIFMGIWSCRIPDPRFLSSPVKENNVTEDVEGKMEIVEEEPYNPNVSKLKEYLRNITKVGKSNVGGKNMGKTNVGKTNVGGNKKEEFEALEMVSQDELFKILSQRQKEFQEIATSVSRESRRRARRKSQTYRKNRKTLKRRNIHSM